MWLTIRSGEARGKSMELDGQDLLLGRGDDCDVVLADPRVSRRHAVLRALKDGSVSLQDLGSGNGTFVNGARVDSTVLRGNEQIQIGDTVLVSSREAPSEDSGATILGASDQSRSQSAIHRLVLQRSVRRATLLSAAAVVLAGMVVTLFATGVLSGGGDATEAVKRVIRQATPSTVLVEARRGDERAGGGTGWVLDAGGLIVTNAHVIDGGSTFRVGVAGEHRDAEVVGVAPCEDLAVLRVRNAAGLQALPLGDQSRLELGETVVAVGYPRNASLEASLTSTTGVVSVARAPFREASLDIPRFPNVVQTDAAINPGSSGGPLLNLKGELIAVNSAGRTLSRDGRIIQGQNYAIGVDRVKEVVATLRQGRSIAWTGLSFDYPTPKDLEERDLPPGLLVGQAVRGTAGETAARGHEGNLIVAVNDKPVDNSLASYCDAVGGLKSGQTVTLSVLRPGRSSANDVRVVLE